MTYTPPALGTVWAFLMPGDKPSVLVKVYKFDTIRQQAYWVAKEIRTFKTVDLAKAYVDRVMG